MQRRIGLLGATAINIITMIGIGPLVTVPLVLSALVGPSALLAWIAGALVALCDGMVWAELGSRFPGSGGTYTFLRESFGANSWGRGLAFLFTWQMLLFAPALLASGAIGAVQYSAYLMPSIAHDAVAKGVMASLLAILMTVGLLARLDIVQKLSRAFAVIAIATLLVAIAAGLLHPQWQHLLAFPALRGSWPSLALAFGTGLYIALYDYVGYAQATLLGDELREPARTTPRSIFWAIAVVALLYILLQVSVLVTPISGDPQFFAATAVAHGFGGTVAAVFVVLVVLTAFASLYGNLLGFARIPFAAARDGNFFSDFSRLGHTTQVPFIGVVAIGAATIPLCFFSLDFVIAILTAGIVLIQAIAQIVAVLRLRRTRDAAPFSMPFYPLPAMIALGGWLLAFVSTGSLAMIIGTAWLCIGVLTFVGFARMRRLWPFALAASIVVLVTLGSAPAQASTISWPGASIRQENGHPVFTVAGKPFFVWGAAFFYERIPAEEWQYDLDRYKNLGINTIDLYVPWNWHELSNGNFDFDGHTNHRRNLQQLLKIIDDAGFKIILRPGPVIRNEWRNGGYPAWLLQRPEYAMPLHDILTGRYPATATLQNAHADAAGAEWLANATHLHYAARWLHRVLQEVTPYRRDIIAIALDDDQGAYIDNDTWPGPHWRAYIDWLKSTVQASVGTEVTLMINTYEQKVTAASPVWAWGDWYQSDAYQIGLHDLTQLDFATDLLATQPNAPTMIAEFQAGWLQGADEGKPRPSDPRNTTLALNELLQLGAHGIVNFPLQDTINPDGWEAPWANWSYAWDAAFTADGEIAKRYASVRAFGLLERDLGSTIATLHPVSDMAIAWTPSIYPSSSVSSLYFEKQMQIVIDELARCRAEHFSCRLIDLRYATNQELFRQNAVIFSPDAARPVRARVVARLGALRAFGVKIYPSVREAERHVRPILRGLSNARLLVGINNGPALLDILNPANHSVQINATHLTYRGRTFAIAAARIPPLGARVYLFDVPFHLIAPHRPSQAVIESTNCELWAESWRGSMQQQSTRRQSRLPSLPCDITFRNTPTSRAIAMHIDQHNARIVVDSKGQLFSRMVAARPKKSGGIVVTAVRPFGVPSTAAFSDDVSGHASYRIVDGNLTLRIAHKAGARSRVFSYWSMVGETLVPHNYATGIGLFRDAVWPSPSISKRDYIAAYTHPLPAGTFNRRYHCRDNAGTTAEFSLSCHYDAPDIPNGGARFSRTYTVTHGVPGIRITETFSPHDPASNAQLVSLSGFRRYHGDTSLIEPGGHCLGVFHRGQHTLLRLCWHPGDVTSATLRDTRGASIATIRFMKRHISMNLNVVDATSVEQARTLLEEKSP